MTIRKMIELLEYFKIAHGEDTEVLMESSAGLDYISVPVDNIISSYVIKNDYDQYRKVLGLKLPDNATKAVMIAARSMR